MMLVLEILVSRCSKNITYIIQGIENGGILIFCSYIFNV
jgi:hypothetical protein